MTTTNTVISRKSFLHITAGAIAGAAFLNVPQLSFAAKARAKATPFSQLPDAVKLAAESELVQICHQNILDSAATIKNTSLRRMTVEILKNPNPTFMQEYQMPGQKEKVYNKLVSLGLIDTAKTPLDKFMPPYKGSAPQPFYSAPGSGYASHHAYPGGLATHTAANLKISEGIYNTYIDLFNSSLSRDIIIAAQALHDLAKPFVFQWKEDQSSLTEYQIAGTGAHHIFSLAEVIYRNFPAEEIVAQACAHQTPGNQKEEAAVVGFLTAAAVIAGKDPVAIGIITKENTLPTPHKQEGYIVSLGDHDYVLSGPACQKSVKLLKTIAAKDYGLSQAALEGEQFNRMRNYMGAQLSMMYLDSIASENDGYEKIRRMTQNLIIK